MYECVMSEGFTGDRYYSMPYRWFKIMDIVERNGMTMYIHV